MEFAMDIPNLALATPELMLGIGAMVLLMVGVFMGETSTRIVTGLSVALIVLAGIWLIWSPAEGEAFHGAFVMDPFARLMKILVLIGSGVAIAMSVGFARLENFDRFEYPILVVLATLGMLLMVSANDLIAGASERTTMPFRYKSGSALARLAIRCGSATPLASITR